MGSAAAFMHSAAMHKRGDAVNYHYNNPAEADWISHTISPSLSLSLPVCICASSYNIPLPPPSPHPSLAISSLSVTVAAAATTVYTALAVFTRDGGFMGMLMGDIPPSVSEGQRARLWRDRPTREPLQSNARHLVAKFIPRPPS